MTMYATPEQFLLALLSGVAGVLGCVFLARAGRALAHWMWRNSAEGGEW